MLWFILWKLFISKVTLIFVHQENNSDDRSSTTPSPSEEFKEPDPLTTVKSRSSSSTSRSLGESSASASYSSLEKEPSNDSNDDDKSTKNQTDVTVETKSDEQICESKRESDECEDPTEKPIEKSIDKEEEKDIETIEQDNIKQETKNDSEFVEVADKSTDTCSVTSASCTKHSFNLMTTVIPANEVPEVANTQEVWETVLESGCVTTASDSGIKKSGDGTYKQGKQDGDKGPKDEGQQVMITTCGINQLGIEVEDISENEEDIDPGQGLYL